MSHTPGPWTMASEPYEDGTPYCRIKAGNPFLSNEEMGFELTAIMRPEDASLIVSAPLMLAALELVLKLWPNAEEVSARTGFDLPDYVVAGLAAIKAARGE